MADLFDRTTPETAPTPPTASTAPTTADLDVLLVAQLAVAWAGEGGEDKRLGWWRCDLISEYGGEDLFKRLVPHTWQWATLQAAREAARRHDARMRARSHDADRISSLFSLGFEIDERIDERLADLKRTGRSPAQALPALAEIIATKWDRDAFTRWLTSHGETAVTADPAGRRIKGNPPTSLPERVARLLAALAPLADAYPLPHFRKAV